MTTILGLSNKKGYNCGVASYLTQHDEHIIQYNNVYQILWVNKGNVKISLTHLNKSLGKDDCVFLGKNEMFRLTSDESYELHYIQFTEDFYCINESDKTFLDRCSYFNNTESINYLKLENQYKKIVETYVGLLTNLQKEPQSELNNLLVHNTIQRILLFTLSMDVKNFQSFNAKKLQPFQLTLLNKFNDLLKNNIKKERTVAFYTNALAIDTIKMQELCKRN